MARSKRFFVLGAVVAIGLALTSVARGTIVDGWVSYEDCLRGNGYSEEDRIACCKAFGGSWVVIYDAEGVEEDAFCDPFEGFVDPSRAPSPSIDGTLGKTSVSNQTPPQNSGSSTIEAPGTPGVSQQPATSTGGETYGTLGSPTRTMTR